MIAQTSYDKVKTGTMGINIGIKCYQFSAEMIVNSTWITYCPEP